MENVTYRDLTSLANEVLASKNLGLTAFCNSETSHSTTSSNYAHGRNMANSGSYRPNPGISLSSETGYGDSLKELKIRKLNA